MAPAATGYRVGMDDEGNEGLGRLSDEEEDREESSTTDGPAADGEYDPAQGSPGDTAHPAPPPD
jgi:hypothetical protein